MEVEYSEKVKWFYNNEKSWIEKRLTEWINQINSFDERGSLEEWAYDEFHNVI